MVLEQLDTICINMNLDTDLMFYTKINLKMDLSIANIFILLTSNLIPCALRTFSVQFPFLSICKVCFMTQNVAYFGKCSKHELGKPSFCCCWMQSFMKVTENQRVPGAVRTILSLMTYTCSITTEKEAVKYARM